MKKVRVRFAPSPTGYLHVGGVRTLLFNWLYAKKHGGELVLRIEDTDQKRSTPENERMMMDDVKALHFDYQEGPDVPGAFGPYRQSERFSIYAKLIQQLLDEDKAFFCFCSDDLITQKREAAIKMGRIPLYDGTCSRLSKEEVAQKLAEGGRPGVRMRSLDKSFVVEDLVKGRVEFKAGTVGDFMIARAPMEHEKGLGGGIGMPVYNFSCVVDDHMMELTHILRGEDHLSNTVKQLMIYDVFGWEPPQFAHMAMVLGADRQKLSKRNGDVSARDYIDRGYLPEALLNFLALLGWWPPKELTPVSGHPEILSLEEMASVFDTAQMQKAPAVFDVDKLTWMNGFYIRMLSISDIYSRAKPFLLDTGLSAAIDTYGDTWMEQVVDLVRGEVSILKELPEKVRPFLEDTLTLDTDATAVLAEAGAKEVVQALQERIEALTSGETPDWKAMIKEIGKSVGVKGKGLFMPIRVAVSGVAHGPDLITVLTLLGRERLLKRIGSII